MQVKANLIEGGQGLPLSCWSLVYSLTPCTSHFHNVSAAVTNITDASERSPYNKCRYKLVLYTVLYVKLGGLGVSPGQPPVAIFRRVTAAVRVVVSVFTAAAQYRHAAASGNRQ